MFCPTKLAPTVRAIKNSRACYLRAVKRISARPQRRNDFGTLATRVRACGASLLVPLNYRVKTTRYCAILHLFVHGTDALTGRKHRAGRSHCITQHERGLIEALVVDDDAVVILTPAQQQLESGRYLPPIQLTQNNNTHSQAGTSSSASAPLSAPPPEAPAPSSSSSSGSPPSFSCEIS